MPWASICKNLVSGVKLPHFLLPSQRHRRQSKSEAASLQTLSFSVAMWPGRAFVRTSCLEWSCLTFYLLPSQSHRRQSKSEAASLQMLCFSVAMWPGRAFVKTLCLEWSCLTFYLLPSQRSAPAAQAVTKMVNGWLMVGLHHDG